MLLWHKKCSRTPARNKEYITKKYPKCQGLGLTESPKDTTLAWYMIRAAINGFGRIGRTAFRVWHARKDLQKQLDLVAINTSGSMPVSSWAHLLKYDTTYGRFPHQVGVEEANQPEAVSAADPLIGYFKIHDKKYPVLAQREPAKLPWKKYQIDVVIEATGVFRSEETVKPHLTAGAKKVLLSTPSKGGNIGTYVLGANTYKGQHTIADNASCTTNCIAPVAAILQAKFGILKAAMTTIHGYTDSQNLQDGSHKDLRRARAAAQNMVPTSTGAAVATTKTLPELAGLFDGTSVRIPLLIGSISDITLLLKQKTTVKAVNQAFKDATQNPLWKSIVAVTEEPLVSADIIGRSESAIVDLALTKVIDGDLVKVFAWYDNEWGYCNRLLEQAINIGKTNQ